MNMCNTKGPKISSIKVDGDILLTPLTCASLINEILKTLVYQKLLIPFPYNCLKNAVMKKRNEDLSLKKQRINFMLQKQFQMASVAYDTLETIMQNIQKEFMECKEGVNEVLIIFGSTPFMAKEVFYIKLHNLTKGHVESNHITDLGKNQRKILRTIFLSDEWLTSMETPLTTTNMYLMINKSTKPVQNEFFIENNNYSLPINIKQTIINLHHNSDNDNCCKNLEIYKDDLKEVYNSEGINIESIDNSVKAMWYQAKLIFKGYKDSFINRVSASELW